MRDNYKCPRCGYESKRRSNMYTHLIRLKKQCPASRIDIELTNEIKDYILCNRVYHIKPQPTVEPQQPTINQTINVYNQMNNFINKMDPLEKLAKYTQYNNVELVGIEEHIENTYECQISKLENNSFKEFYLDHSSILDIVDTITNCTKMEKFNIIHDGSTNKLKIYNNGVWESVMFEKGVGMLVSKIQSCYLDYYETFLLRKGYHGSPYNKQVIKEKLQDYYKLLVCFELDPLVKGQSDDNILQDFHSSTYELEEVYYPLYQQIESDIKHCEVNKVRKQIFDIIKTNNKSNIIDLNTKMMDLFRVDESFKEIVLEKLRVSLAQLNV